MQTSKQPRRAEIHPSCSALADYYKNCTTYVNSRYTKSWLHKESAQCRQILRYFDLGPYKKTFKSTTPSPVQQTRDNERTTALKSLTILRVSSRRQPNLLLSDAQDRSWPSESPHASPSSRYPTSLRIYSKSLFATDRTWHSPLLAPARSR
jgi:hypothetical protein